MERVYTMRLRKYWLILCSLLLCKNISAFEATPTMAILFTPIIIPDIISFKTAFEYALHRKINLVIPVEAKYVNYRSLIKYFTRNNNKNFPEDLYKSSNFIKPGWNIDYSHTKIATGFGVKIFPFGETMRSAFFIKNIYLVGFERFNAFSAEGIRDGVFLGTALTLGYNWVVANFICGLELGAEYDYHSNAIEKLPRLFKGFAPLFQFSLGFIR